jgi:tRNA pseudouridine55 synthase
MESASVVGVCKPVGMTPLEALREYVAASGGRSETRRSYAGRLDPMAEGLLVVLEGEACEAQEAWQHHGKEYAWEMLLGLSSDSYDVLGLVQLLPPADWDAAVRDVTRALEHALVGRRMQPYPPFSSARVAGHPLFWWAQQGRLHEVQIPRVEVEVQERALCN